MSQILFEQYKDALRRGHLALQAGRLNLAIEAYREAIALAPDRALPYASLGSAWRRLGRPIEAETAFGAALERAPHDEGALRGRAALREDQGRRSEAAEDFEILAAALERADRLIDACAAAGRSLQLAESRMRRRMLERLVARLTELGPEEAAAEALRLSRRLLETGDAGHEARGSATELSAAGLGPSPAPGALTAAAVATVLDPSARLAEAQSLLDTGELAQARQVLLELASALRLDGRRDAALDVGLQLLQLNPSDFAAQIEVAAIQCENGWTRLATEKLRLLAHLARLDEDGAASVAIANFASERGIAGEFDAANARA